MVLFCHIYPKHATTAVLINPQRPTSRCLQDSFKIVVQVRMLKSPALTVQNRVKLGDGCSMLVKDQSRTTNS